MPLTGDRRQTLLDTIAALQGQRGVLGDALVDEALAPLLARLSAENASEPSSQPERRLRQVSVLFLDIVGSTRLIQHLDPEDVQSVMDGALAGFTAIVVRHGGEVMSYAGDNVKAAFGANGTREDDAERAVLCGLEMLQEALRRGGDVNRQFGHEGFNARVGIHTGAVVRGGGIQQENSLSGLAVTIAARMEQTAPAGGLRISQDTWALVRGLFDADGEPPIAVKGHDTPIASWLVRGTKPRAFRLPARGIEGLETALVGREHELARLDAAFEGLLADRAPRALTLIADAGLGKSRLLHEFQHRLAAHPASWWLMQARSQPSSLLQPYGLLRDLVSRRLEITDSDSADVARGKLVHGLAAWLGQPDDPAPEVLGQLIGLDFTDSPAVQRLGSDAGLLRDRSLAALGLWLSRLAASDGSPVVLLLDDLHWSDDASLDALAKVLKAAASAPYPLLALLCARPGLLERRPAWGEELERHERLTLRPLDASQQAELTGALLQRLNPVPAVLDELILRRAEGNPFYAEELVKMLLDQDVIETRDGHWHFHPDRLQPGRLPTTLTGVIQARIDALDGDARRALQMASVIGPVFWDDALGALDPHGPATLPTLRARAMVQPRPTSAFDDTAEESFHHHLLHQVSYDTVLKPERREAHARAAAWLTARVGERGDEYLAITAEHHARAGQHTLAADWFQRAAGKAAARGASTTALEFIDRAQTEGALAPDGWPADRLAEAENMRRIYCDTLALRERQGQALDRLMTLGEQHGNAGWIAEALSGRTLWEYRMGRLTEAEATARRGATVAVSSDHPVAAAICYGNLAWMDIERGRFDAARENLVEATQWATKARERMVRRDDGIYEVQMLLVQGELHAEENKQQAATEVMRLALAAAQRQKARRVECSCHQALAGRALVCFDLAEAALHIEAAFRLAAEFALEAQVGDVIRLGAKLHLLAGRWDEAEREAARGLAQCLTTNDPCGALRVRGIEAEANWLAGRVDVAVRIWQRMAAEFLERGEPEEAEALRMRLADAQAASGRSEDVQASRQIVLDALARTKSGVPLKGEFELAARLAAWRVLHRAGDTAAETQLTQAATELDLELGGFDDPDVRERIVRNVPSYRDVVKAVGLTPADFRVGATRKSGA